MKKLIGLLVIAQLLACSPKIQTNKGDTNVVKPNKKDAFIDIVLLQANDVYQISPSSGDDLGGMARVATLKQKLRIENPNTLFCMAGDFLNPSVIGTIKYNGRAISGEQMVAAMNTAGVDLVTFGNHEFDLKQSELQSRINESEFDWITNNAYETDSTMMQPFGRQMGKNEPKTSFSPHKIVTFKDSDGTLVKIGFFGTVLPANKKPYIVYKDVYEECRNSVNDLKKKGADLIIGLTHVAIDDDKEIAKQNPDISLIMGGHEHVNMKHAIGNVVITKADANAKTVWIHKIRYNKKTKEKTLTSELVTVNNTIADEFETQKVVQRWEFIADSCMRAQGFVPDEVVTDVTEMLDAREITNRYQQSNLGNIIGHSMAMVAKKPVDAAFFNSGSIRLDDQIKGKMTQKDVISILPYGGSLVEMDIKGSELRKVLGGGLLSKGRGGYLQWYNIGWEKDYDFLIGGKALELDKTYHIITSTFLFSGAEGNLDFFNEKNPYVSNVSKPDPKDKNDLRNDIRQAVIQYYKKK